MNKYFTILIITIFFTGRSFCQGWEPVEVPIKTVWADEVDPSNVLPEYPRPVMVRSKWKNLNGLWDFQSANEGDPLPFKGKMKTQILVPFPWESSLSGIRKQYESRRAVYRRTFEIPSSWKDQEVILHFGAVDFEATVYVNGKSVGTHKGGYDAFSFNITNYLNEKGSNQLIVEVYDPGSDEGIARGKQNNNRFSDPQRYSYTPSSGIWQTVWMEPVPKTHISEFRIEPDIDAETITVTLNANGDLSGKKVDVVVKDMGNIVAEGTGDFNMPFQVSLPNPKLWSPSDPFLYDVELSIADSTGICDQVVSYIGMRKISIAKVGNLQKIMLNNEFVFQMGPLDQGYWPAGIYTAPTDEALKWDVEKIKEFGYNMVRKHIKIEPQRWYYWCDKIGLLVWQDMPSTMGTRTEDEKVQFEWELTRMVQTHWNHPSIIIWVVFNEHWGLYDVERLTESTMKLDETRLVIGNSGIDAGKPDIDYEVGHIKDNHSYRPPSVPFASNKRAVVNGEYGAIGYNIPGHMWDEDGPWVHYNYSGIKAATEEYEKFIKMILGFQKEGLSAAVYTQWTDLENEMNGIYTYDRKVIKLDKETVIKANLSTHSKLSNQE